MQGGIVTTKVPGLGKSAGVKSPAFVAMLRFTPALYSDPTNLRWTDEGPCDVEIVDYH